MFSGGVRIHRSSELIQLIVGRGRGPRSTMSALPFECQGATTMMMTRQHFKSACLYAFVEPSCRRGRIIIYLKFRIEPLFRTTVRAHAG